MSAVSSATGAGRRFCAFITVLLVLAITFGVPAANALVMGANGDQEVQRDTQWTHHKAVADAGADETPCNMETPDQLPVCPMKSGCLRHAACTLHCGNLVVIEASTVLGASVRAVPVQFPRYALNIDGRGTAARFRPPIR